VSAGVLDRPPRRVALRREGVRKNVAEPAEGRLVGQVIGRALELAGLSRQEVAFTMGYADESSLCRWIAGVETPQFARLWQVAPLRPALVLAWAEHTEDIEVTTQISVRRRGR
jgi:hypothetical protein